MSSANFKPRTAAASRGFLATARLSCLFMWQAQLTSLEPGSSRSRRCATGRLSFRQGERRWEVGVVYAGRELHYWRCFGSVRRRRRLYHHNASITKWTKVLYESHFRPKGTTVHDVLLVSQVTGFYIAPFPGYQYWYWYWSKFLLWTGVYAILTPPFGVNPWTSTWISAAENQNDHSFNSSITEMSKRTSTYKTQTIQ